MLIWSEMIWIDCIAEALMHEILSVFTFFKISLAYSLAS